MAFLRVVEADELDVYRSQADGFFKAQQSGFEMRIYLLVLYVTKSQAAGRIDTKLQVAHHIIAICRNESGLDEGAERGRFRMLRLVIELRRESRYDFQST
jgi:hypothetical protein